MSGWMLCQCSLLACLHSAQGCWRVCTGLHVAQSLVTGHWQCTTRIFWPAGFSALVNIAARWTPAHRGLPALRCAVFPAQAPNGARWSHFFSPDSTAHITTSPMGLSDPSVCYYVYNDVSEHAGEMCAATRSASRLPHRAMLALLAI